MSIIKKIIISILIVIFIITIYLNKNRIYNIYKNFINNDEIVILKDKNKDINKYDFDYVKLNKKLKLENKQDLINILYTIISYGYDEYQLTCPPNYISCINDFNSIINNKEIINNINNFVHPYNSFKNVKISVDNYGNIKMFIIKKYDRGMISFVEEKVNKIIKEKYNSSLPIKSNLLMFHDYIVDNTEYNLNIKEDTDNAYGLLYNGKAQCSGYADTMAIILNKFNIKNYKVASKDHIWNAVNIDDSWLHMDLTWDDPIVEDHFQIDDERKHKFFMIDTKALHIYDNTEHGFNNQIYSELK